MRTVDPSECRPWRGAMMPNGYGTTTVNGATQYAHRVAYEHSIGPIPEGLHIDHLCRNRSRTADRAAAQRRYKARNRERINAAQRQYRATRHQETS